jgi:hypothetical protein
MPVRDSWSTYLIEVQLAKNYTKVNLDAWESQHSNPILEILLPSLLYIRLVSLLDEALKEYVVASMPSKTNLDGRIDFLHDQGRLKDAARLHAIRLTRNALAHDPSRSCSWGDLEAANEAVGIELQALGLVGPRPTYEFYAERSLPVPPTEPGYLFSQVYGFGLKLECKKFVEFKWTVNRGDAPNSPPAEGG